MTSPHHAYDLAEDGRLRGGAGQELVEAGFADEITHAVRLAPWLSRADLAHAIALTDCGALPPAQAAKLLSGLLELDDIPPAEFPWDPAIGDAFNSRERELARRIGKQAAGWLSAGRPRREAFRVALRLLTRAGSLALQAELAAFADALAHRASDHVDDLAVDYTYLQPAQPTSLGHLLVGYAQQPLRDALRLQRVTEWTDQNVAGAGGSAGSSWPIDRQLLAQLLGCRQQAVHTKDAMWQWDGYVELLSALAIAATGLSQLGQDFEIYASQEFGFLELADAHSRTSALMPQKKNPYALAVLRTHAGAASGALASALTVLHTGSARTDHFHLLNGTVPHALEQTTAMTRLASAVVAQMQIDAERISQRALESAGWAADLADHVARQAGVDYRTAHTVVGRIMRDLAEAGTGPPDQQRLTDELNRCLAEAGGSSSTVELETVQQALDVVESARSRPQIGASSPEQVRQMVHEVHQLAREIGERVSAQQQRLQTADEHLYARARELASDPLAARS